MLALAPPGLPLHFILPLASAVVYVAAALFLKRAAEAGVSAWRSTRVCNSFAAILFTPLWLLGGQLPDATIWWQPAVTAFLFLLGQLFTMLALRSGDVSITTPVLGLKIILVAVFIAVLLPEPLTRGLWLAAVLSSAGIVLLQFSRPPSGSKVGANILLAGLAAAAYALFDVLVQKWSPAWGAGRFLPLMMGCAALYSLPFGWRRPTMDAHSSKHATIPLLSGAVCLAVQAILFVSSIAIYHQAAVSNVLYSSRGLWSVLAVWLVGHWFGNRERHHGARILLWRFLGTILLMIAIIIVLRENHV
jgi:drug/metabolite transporter (DMT)-like permease